MKLRTKLLLGVGILLFSMVIIMYILPTFFVRKDVYQAADQIHELLTADHQQLVTSQQQWLESVLTATKQNTNALLLMLYAEPQFSSKFTFTQSNSDKNIWIALARLASYDPHIGFVQAHAPDAKKAAIVTSHKTNLYPINHAVKEGDFIRLSLLQFSQGTKTPVYFGASLPEKEQVAPGYTLYALFDLDQIRSQLSGLPTDRFAKGFQNHQTFNESVRQDQANLLWSIKAEMIRVLTPLFVDGMHIEQSNQTLVPKGLARIDPTGNGYVILSDEIYSTTPLFDDALYFKEHLPSEATPPIANGSFIVTAEQSKETYIGNTLLLDNTFCSIGTPLDPLVRQLALSSNKISLLWVNQSAWIGFDGQGNKLSQEQLDGFINANVYDQKSGIIHVGSNTYFFSRIGSFEDNNLTFFDVLYLAGEKSIVSTLLSLEDKLSGRISLQLSLISLATMILVLLFIGRIGFTVIYPVTKLAAATQDIVTGHYEDVVLPDVGKRQDEVAILTRSFADMVKGLQEREKIRGVLDKVVSKDVADEILRTQIHLGGEDRIVSMLFCDIRGFTHITANLPPQKTIQMLNACMTKVSRVIEGEGGVIDKYVGDEVMAIYGAPTTHPDHALRAVSSAMLIVETLKKWNESRLEAGLPVIEMGIGVHTGLVVAGNMGAEDRLNYTVLGANVNLAARLCEVAKPNQLIISEATLAEPNIQESFFTKPLSPISLKGFDHPIQIYEITGFKWEST